MGRRRKIRMNSERARKPYRLKRRMQIVRLPQRPQRKARAARNLQAGKNLLIQMTVKCPLSSGPSCRTRQRRRRRTNFPMFHRRLSRRIVLLTLSPKISIKAGKKAKMPLSLRVSVSKNRTDQIQVHTLSLKGQESPMRKLPQSVRIRRIPRKRIRLPKSAAA